ncbi:MAG TPA: PEP/pyruvate-binding domain-containing protein [Kiritimatiellia bacterium]|nr:PEP/pyruvate-binding domain-containing protein [Kiritimatiellia bacterium]
MSAKPNAPSGIPALDEIVQGLRLGDNVVFQVDRLEDYLFFVRPFARRAVQDGRRCVYLRFAPHPPVLGPDDGFEIVPVDPGAGFDSFSGEVHRIIETRGHGVFYVFDNLSALVAEWATDESLANFFQVTCPYLFELDTITYFALTRGHQAHATVARIRDTTQLLLDVYHVQQRTYLHPLKVWDRYTPRMFLPHAMDGDAWTPVFQSGDAAAVVSVARQSPLRAPAESIAPWDSVFRRLLQYRESGMPLDESIPEIAALKQELTRMLIGDHPDFSRLADRHLTLDDLVAIRGRLIGSGRVGGKAAGMLVARRVLASVPDPEFTAALESHDSFYVGSDVFFTFLVNNDLFRLRLKLSRSSHISREEFADVESRFLAGRFPADILEQFRTMLDYFGQAPIIVRSSSLLEDSYGNAFAGKYRSEFCANQGSPEARLEAFLRAVKLVYASALNPDALTYRRRRGLGESEEQMAILVMRVSGMPHGSTFFPTLAGVAFSRNLYAWSDRIDARQGVIRLVFGLGTHAVNRVGGDYPHMIAVSHPKLRPEIGLKIAKYSQHEMDLLDLQANELVTRPVADAVADKQFPHLHLLVSVMQEGHLFDPFSREVPGAPSQMVFTFNNLIARTPFVPLVGRALAALEKAYGHPVDTEFTAHVDAKGQVRINLLQCRPLWLPGAMGPVIWPEPVRPEQVIFRSDRFISGGEVDRIRFILYIDPRRYAAMTDLSLKKSIGRVVGRINELPSVVEGRVLVLGPGRWGSSNIELGVNVGYADIDNAAVLVELAREEAGHVPEVSYGTHFFQDLVEQRIIYLPVYPDDPESSFNERFFESAPNALRDILPDAAPFEQVVKVIDVPSFARGSFVRVIADPDRRRALCYLPDLEAPRATAAISDPSNF